MRTQVWANGGGTQSAAIAALIVRGEIEPPDLAVIVDTGYEQSTTWAYLESVTAPALVAVGVPIHRIRSADYATVGLYGGTDGESLLIPVFTDQSGDIGKLPTYCSNEWKKRVIQRWITAQGVKQATQWLGISVDEMNRIQKDTGDKWKTRYPLIEKRMNRDECETLVQSMGWPRPPRSSCWMCPNHTAAEWRDIRDNKPEDWQQAIKFDRNIRRRDPHAYLHHDAVPLDQADLDERNGVLFGHCTSGMCFV